MNKFVVKPGYQSITKTFRLPENLVEKMEQLAKENKLSFNNLVIQCLEHAMENLEKGDSF